MPKKVTILGVPVDAITMGEAVARIDGFIEKRTPVLVATANAEMLMRATHDGALRRILQGAAMVTPDGAGTVWAAHHLGHAMPERVAGYDMVQELMREAPAKHRRILLSGQQIRLVVIECDLKNPALAVRVAVDDARIVRGLTVHVPHRAGDRADQGFDGLRRFQLDDLVARLDASAYLRQIDENQVSQLVGGVFGDADHRGVHTGVDPHMLVGIFQMIRDFEIRAIIFLFVIAHGFSVSHKVNRHAKIATP